MATRVPVELRRNVLRFVPSENLGEEEGAGFGLSPEDIMEEFQALGIDPIILLQREREKIMRIKRAKDNGIYAAWEILNDAYDYTLTAKDMIEEIIFVRMAVIGENDPSSMIRKIASLLGGIFGQSTNEYYIADIPIDAVEIVNEIAWLSATLAPERIVNEIGSVREEDIEALDVYV